MNSEEIENMKVADLKKELKSKGLSTTGIKSELVQRLTDYLNSEEKKILQTVDDGDDILDDLPEEDVLGISTSDEVALKASVKSPIIPKPIIGTTVQKISLEKKLSATENAAVDPTATDETNKEKQETKSEEKAKHAKIVMTSPKDSEALVEKKLERAKRFHVPLNDELKKDLRAERFQAAQGNLKTFINPSVVSSTAAKLPVTSGDTDALKRRAERFGLQANETTITAAGSPAKLARRADRFQLNKTSNGTTTKEIPTAVVSEKILKRKERFGDVTAEPVTKMSFRAKRFGISA